ncbi:hypothetical protein PhiH1_155 [Halobacterium phage phiH]|uniref:Uncharacterized protein n=1 Tax=Halobacterium phage phiH TaxID=169684 RepID=A0A3G1ZKS5_BPPHH|nr:hypothetical protein JR051_gp32 [Halobacterium phage phiH]AYM00278.1 hypothetical protein PhiH1_155 [Halobacterium phage phiH]
MTTVTDDGLEWQGDRAISDVPKIDTIALGTGQNEENGASELGNEVHRADVNNSNVELLETGDLGEFEAVIRVKGGTEVPANTEISEISVIAGGSDGGGTTVIIDEFASVPVGDGHTEEFTVPVNPQR